jgi:hypothetical protein
MTCSLCGGCWSLCSIVSSWPSAMIRAKAAGGAIVQLRLELAESPAPAAALWELVGEQQRQAAMVLLAALIARAIAGDQDEDGTAVGE